MAEESDTLTDGEVSLVNRLRAEGIDPEKVNLGGQDAAPVSAQAAPVADTNGAAAAAAAAKAQQSADSPATKADMIRAATTSYRERLDDAMDQTIDAGFPIISGNEGLRRSVCEAACAEIAVDPDFVAGKLQRREFWQKVRQVTEKHAKEQDEAMAAAYGGGGSSTPKKKAVKTVEAAALSQAAAGGTTTGSGGRSAGTLSNQNPWDEGDLKIDWSNPPSEQELLEALDAEAQSFLKARETGRV